MVRRRALSAALGLALPLVGAATAHASPALVRIGVAPRLPAGTQPLAVAASSQRLAVTVALKPRNSGALASYAGSVSDPTSRLYGRFLTTRQFAARFGPTTATINAVKRELAAQGLTHVTLASNHLSVHVSAPAGRLESAFHVQLADVRLPNGRSALVTVEAPAVSARVAPAVQAVVGLDGLQTMRSSREPGRASRRTGDSKSPSVSKRQVTPCTAASSAASSQGAYTADQIANAYSFTGLYNAGDQGAGATVGLYELEPDDPADIAAYQSCYGTSTSISYESVDGGVSPGSGSGEAAFDIEQVIGLAPKAKLIIYQGPNSDSDSPGSGPYDLFAKMVSDDTANVISNSWGECETIEGRTDAVAEETLFEEAAVQGQTIVSASGDDGSEDCDGATQGLPNTNLAVDDPGSQEWVTSVGGTSMTSTTGPAEVVWNSGGGVLSAASSGAGGGGISAFWPMPSYQSNAPASLGVTNALSSGSPCGLSSGNCREVPDVSADADPLHGYLIYYNGTGAVTGQPEGWQGSGGTSGAAPLWGALFALADASSTCASGPVGFVNPALYRAAAAGAYFHDITSGNNDYTGTNKGKFPAAAGFDMASGLGTPNGTALAQELCQQSLRVGQVANQVSQTGTSVKLAPAYALPSGDTIAWRGTGVPAGLSVNPSTGVISGKPTRTGTYAVTLTALDSDAAQRSIHFSWRIQQAPSVVHLTLAAVKTAKPTLTFRVSAGHNEPALSSVVISLPSALVVGRSSKIVVQSSAHRTVAHTGSASGHRVGITLKTAASSFIVVFQSGALKVRTATVTAVKKRTRPSLNFAFAIKDSGGLANTLRTTTRPTS